MTRRLWVVLAGIVLISAVGLTVVVRGRRVDETRRLAFLAASAVAAAELAGAGQWAEAEWDLAGRTYSNALRAEALELGRFVLPDFTVANAGFRGAESAARSAAVRAAESRAQAEDEAQRELTEAEALIAVGEDVSATLGPGPAARRVLELAREALSRARRAQAGGAYRDARNLAVEARGYVEAVQGRALSLSARFSNPDNVRTWNRWKQETIEWSRRERAPAIIVSKMEHTVTLYSAGEVVRTYDAEMGFNWFSDKLVSGDGATPEGRYFVAQMKRGPATLYHKALLIDYPNAADVREFEAARSAGRVAPRSTPGGLIEIHGHGGKGEIWTSGCVALTNAAVDDLFRRVGVGTPVTIIGTDRAPE